MNEVILSQDLVFVDQKEAYTDSLIVAREFEKNHQHVMRDIKKLISNTEGLLDESNFGHIEYIDSIGRTQSKYNLTKDALILLVMGYTTKKAMEKKISYIHAFNKMESYIRNQIDLEAQLFKAMEKEEISFANGSMAGKYLQKRKMEKPINKAEIESILQRLQIDMFEEIKEKQVIH